MASFVLDSNGFSNWVTAHLLAVVLVYPLVRTQQFNHIVDWLEEKSPHSFMHHNSRWVAYLLIVALLGGSLTIAMSFNPAREGFWSSVLQLTQAGGHWEVYSAILNNVLITLGILVCLSFIPIINTLFARLQQVIDDSRRTHFRVIKIQNLEILTPDQLAELLLLITRYLRYAALLLLVSACLTLLFSLYPETEGLVQGLLNKVVAVLTGLWDKTLELLPNLVTLAVILVTTRLALKLLHFFYDGMRHGKIRYSGIDLELVEPTYQLLRFLVIAFALVAAFPYIPGSSSPVFQGLSIFVGFLLSMGSTSLVTNIVSGIVLTYTRGVHIGDRVQIGEAVGDVIERTLLVTRIRTIKNVVISVPNSLTLQNLIINYSAGASEQGVILHTSVTIGYDVPWRQVQQLLMEAARETPLIRHQPEPFVLKTSLDDFYITYELNAYTRQANQMARIYSELHQNILDQFNQAGVEIMSPSYFAYRDGGSITIPARQFSQTERP